MDLKGTPKPQQNDLMDTFLTITSTKPELESTSFLSSLDMDPGQATQLGSPTGSRINLLSNVGGDGLLAALASPPPSSTPSGTETPNKSEAPLKFSDFRRLVSFAVRRETMQAP